MGDSQRGNGPPCESGPLFFLELSSLNVCQADWARWASRVSSRGNLELGPGARPRGGSGVPSLGLQVEGTGERRVQTEAEARGGRALGASEVLAQTSRARFGLVGSRNVLEKSSLDYGEPGFL